VCANYLYISYQGLVQTWFVANRVCELVREKRVQFHESNASCDSENPMYDFSHGVSFDVPLVEGISFYPGAFGKRSRTDGALILA